jgi:polar amino acid transport system substrate-binding protein
MAKKGGIDLLIPVNQSEVDELGVLRTQTSVNQFQKGSLAAYFVHKETKWVYSGRESLKDQSIGIVQGYTYPEPLHSHLQDPLYEAKQLVLASDQGNQRQIKMLASRRITVIPSERIVFWYMARELGLEHEFKDAGVLDMPDELAIFYIGVVKKDKPLATQLVRWLDEGMDSLKRKNQLKTILQKYGV